MDFLPPLDFDVTIAIKLLVAAALGGLVGLERELHGKPAGLRTNMFICVGSALFTILSSELAADAGADPTRIAANLIPGIGFIGAGSIIRARGSVVGLTTAATIFVLASIGMAVGGGRYATALFATGLMVAALWILGWIQKAIVTRKEQRHYRVAGENLEALAGSVAATASELGLALRGFSTRRRDDGFEAVFDLKASEEQHSRLVQQFARKQLTCEARAEGLEE